MNIDGMIRLQSPIRLSSFLQLCLRRGFSDSSSLIGKGLAYCVVEIPSGDGLLNGRDIICIRIRLYDNFHPFAQTGQLITNIACTVQTLVLQELLETELLTIASVRPLFPDIQQGKMVSTCTDEVLSCLVGMQLLVFGAVEERPGFRQHGNYGQNLLRKVHRETDSCKNNKSLPHQYTRTSRSREWL